MSGVLEAVGALVPSVGVGLIFWFAIRAILRADQRERAVLRRYEAAQDRADAEALRADGTPAVADEDDGVPPPEVRGR